MKKPTEPLIESLRTNYHRKLQNQIWGFDGKDKRPSNSDRGSTISKKLAEGMLASAASPTTSPSTGQTAGTIFEQLTKEFIEGSFSALAHIRPGQWHFSTKLGAHGITSFEQYAHLAVLQRILEESENSEFRATFATDYLVKPDIVVGRTPLSDDEINQAQKVVSPSMNFAKYTPLRSKDITAKPIMHASISCKWTIRSDRVQNTRTEALNLIRNRKGNLPHIVAVTGEPMPTRLASLATGTGDLDCVYHMALNELEQSLQEVGDESQKEVFELLVEGNRLRDISDLPFDLAV